MNTTPNAVPVSLIREKNVGKIVAAKTVRTEIIGSEDVPAGNISLVANIPQVTSKEAIDIETKSEGNDIVEALFSSMATSDDMAAAVDDDDISSFSSSTCLSSSCCEVDPSVSVGSPALAIENKNAKYSATTTLSAATFHLTRRKQRFVQL